VAGIVAGFPCDRNKIRGGRMKERRREGDEGEGEGERRGGREKGWREYFAPIEIDGWVNLSAHKRRLGGLGSAVVVTQKASSSSS
jgi:hypothetical protein